MAAALRYLFKPKSKAEKYGLKGVPVSNTPPPVNQTLTSSSQPGFHPKWNQIAQVEVEEDPSDLLFNADDTDPIPIRCRADGLSPVVIPPGVSILTPLASIPTPGFQELQGLLETLWSMAQGMSEIRHNIRSEAASLKEDCSMLLGLLTKFEPSSPQFGEHLIKMKTELAAILSQLKKWDQRNKLVKLRHKQYIMKRMIRCREICEQITNKFNSLQGAETLSIAKEQLRLQQNQNQDRIAELQEKFQADEEELQTLLRRETGDKIPQEIILQKNIKWRDETTAFHSPGRFTVYRGELWTGELVAIKISEKQPGLDGEGRNFGRRILRYASTWASFDNPYILPFLGMGVRIIDKPVKGSKKSYKVFFVSPWVEDGNAVRDLILMHVGDKPELFSFQVNFIRNAHEQQQFVDIPKIVRDVALGLRYLHHRDSPCIHASLRGENVLIKTVDAVEQACLNGFALTKEQRRDDPIVEFSGEDNVYRWKPVELLEYEKVPLEPSCDIWSWAMTALELYSGLEPFYQFTLNSPMNNAIIKGTRPQRSEYPDFDKYAPQPDAYWALLEKCWRREPESRPTIQEVLDELDRIDPKHAESS
ncbi:kinase-like protein [Ceratobasidium sp. AG-I]|nr:kinase-like protein [Ceratobasidium sp. AG-I]